MTILCCYTKLHPAAEKALKLYAPDAEMVDVTGGDFGYWNTLASHWDDEDDLIVIEHDIEITEKVIPGFLDCPQAWCTHPYHHKYTHKPDAILGMSLGCTKLSLRARQAAPINELCRVEVPCFACHMAGLIEGVPACWLHIDAKLACLLDYKGIEVCIHLPNVVHHEDDHAEIYGSAGKIESPC